MVDSLEKLSMEAGMEGILLTQSSELTKVTLDAYNITAVLRVVGRREPEDTPKSRIFKVYLMTGDNVVFRLKIWKQYISETLIKKFRIGNVNSSSYFPIFRLLC